ncbi:hypothetical protein B0H13DRAFT_1864691 [Mycena leptocephala]|nr:hypothetical protein B0H13DRAFT_1864691 [Mycena leptocephala]
MWTSKQLHIVKQIVLEEGTVLPTQELIAVFGTRRKAILKGWKLPFLEQALHYDRFWTQWLAPGSGRLWLRRTNLDGSELTSQTSWPMCPLHRPSKKLYGENIPTRFDFAGITFGTVSNKAYHDFCVLVDNGDFYLEERTPPVLQHIQLEVRSYEVLTLNTAFIRDSAHTIFESLNEAMMMMMMNSMLRCKELAEAQHAEREERGAGLSEWVWAKWMKEATRTGFAERFGSSTFNDFELVESIMSDKEDRIF